MWLLYCVSSTTKFIIKVEISRKIELKIIDTSHFLCKVKTKKLAIKKPIKFPTFAFEDQNPTMLPYYFTLKYLLNIVKRAGKKESWHIPNKNTEMINIAHLIKLGIWK